MIRRGLFSKIGSAAAALSLLAALVGCGAKGPTQPYSIASQRQQQARIQSRAVAASLIVKLRSAASSDGVAQAVGARTLSSLPQLGMVVLGLPAGSSPARAMASLAGNPAVQYAEPDFRMKAIPRARTQAGAGRQVQLTPSNEPGLARQWGHTAIDVFGAWNFTLGDPRVVVAVVDTGVDMTHPDLESRIVPSGARTFVPGSTSPMDDNGHGTHVAGVIAADLNSSGIAGVAPRCRILPVKVLDSQGSGNTSDIVAGLLYAADAGARIINLSLGGGSGSKALEEAIRYAKGKGSLIIAAMGNEGKNIQEYPAAYSGVISVGATGREGEVADFSNYGGWISVSAPGDGIWSTMTTYETTLSEECGGTGHCFLSGTSMATPYVAGVAALVASLYPNLGPEAIKAAIERTTDDIGVKGFDGFFGSGQINARRAVTGK